MASLDPLARHDFMATVLAAMAEDGVSVVLSSHVLAELERVADYLVILSRGSVQVAGEVDDLLACHVLASGPDVEADRYAEGIDVVHALHSKAQTQFLIRTNGSVNAIPPNWNVRPVSLEELAMAYLREPGAASLPGPSRATTGRTDGGGTMTAFAAPTRPGHRSASPLVPWRQMGWVIWRQNRATLAVVVALLGAASVYLYISGEQIRQQSSVYFAAGPQLSLSTALFQVIAPLIGAFVGAPLLARELETGTFRFTWTQGFGRARWAIATLAPLAIAVTVVVGAFGMLVSWAYGPRIGGEDGLSPLAGTTFDFRGVAVAGWVLLAFAIGVLAGLLIRRVVPAMFATVVAWTGLAVGAGFLRRYYEAPLVTTKLNPALSDWVMGTAVDPRRQTRQRHHR